MADSWYAGAVARGRRRVGIAERGARRIRLSRFSAQERANVVVAQQLFRIALGGASPAEPVTAYRRLIPNSMG